MRLSHNMASLNIYMTNKRVGEKQSKALNNISTGYKVNNGKDDPNAIAQSERMRMQIRGLQMGSRNLQDGLSMLQTAEGGINNISSVLQRIRELSVQAGSGSNSLDDKQIIQNEISQLVDGIDQIVDTTEFNGKKILNKSKINEGIPSSTGNYVNLEMLAGANAGENVEIPIYDLSSSQLGISPTKSIKDIDVTAGGTSIDDAIKIVDAAIDNVGSITSKYGALENRFEDSMNDLIEISDSMEGADSSIRDADIAQEMMEVAKDNVLMDAGNAIMAQTNKLPQEILTILQNLKSR